MTIRSALPPIPIFPGTRRVRRILSTATIGPRFTTIIRGFRRVSDSYEQRILVGETWPREHERLADYLRPDELQLAFNFRFLLARYDARRFRAAIEQTEKSFGPTSWPTWTLSNHDFSRHISRYSRDGDGEARARVAAVMLLDAARHAVHLLRRGNRDARRGNPRR